MSLGEFIPSSNTKLLLHLNGNSNDSSGNGNNGTDTAITYSQANGRFGMGAGFNGSSSKIGFSKNSTTYLYNDWTMVAWVKRGDASSGTVCIYQMGNCRFDFGDASYYDGGGDRNISDYSIPTDTTNWYFYVWTKSSTAGQKLYRNGVLVGTEASTSDNADYYSNVNIGRFDSPGKSWFNGNVDEFILESGVWTPQQVAKYYTYSKGYYSCL